MLYYEYIKNLYRLIEVDLSLQKELYANPKSIQQIEFDGQLKKLDNSVNSTDVDDEQSMFVVTILEKIKETRLKFSKESLTVF